MFAINNFELPSLRGTASVSMAGRSNPQRYIPKALQNAKLMLLIFSRVKSSSTRNRVDYYSFQKI
jgi:hypothetical protein